MGGSLFYPIKTLKDWGFLIPAWYKSKISGDVRRCDLTRLEESAETLCSITLTPRHSFIHPVTNTEVDLSDRNFDYCFKAVYADALLKSIKAKPGIVQVRYHPLLQNIMIRFNLKTVFYIQKIVNCSNLGR